MVLSIGECLHPHMDGSSIATMSFNQWLGVALKRSVSLFLVAAASGSAACAFMYFDDTFVQVYPRESNLLQEPNRAVREEWAAT